MSASSLAVLVRRPRSEESPASRPVRGARRTAHRPSKAEHWNLFHHDGGDARENTEEIGREKKTEIRTTRSRVSRGRG